MQTLVFIERYGSTSPSMAQGQISEADSRDEKAPASLICWLIWKNRNQEFFEGNQWEPQAIYEKALLAYGNNTKWCVTYLREKGPSLLLYLHPTWQPPSDDFTQRITVDGALNSRDGNGGVGLVARN